MIALVLAAAIAASPTQAVSPTTPAPVAQTSTEESPVRLEDIIVSGRPLDSLISSFVGEVAAPNPHRGIARWENGLCIGAANLRPEAAQYLVDRVSTVASDLGLRPGAPGCAPNVMIIATTDAKGTAERLVQHNRRDLRMGGAGMDRGGTALQAFQTSDRPVRWWQVSIPVDSETGLPATRIPGECNPPCEKAGDYAPNIPIFAASRLSTQIVDKLFRTIIILDVDQVSRVTPDQLADYVSMVTFAQINPEADTGRYASILNLFEDPGSAPGLTQWDRAYLEGLYDAERTRQNRRAGRTEIAASIRRAHEDLRNEEAQP
ncbi:hypothetical protein [Brevundimonas sp.]|uniref:hypothetical protein n=1 Tax=Brevundimonas sp. TaxID=1871086 RepID=UPI003D6D1964